MIPLRLRVEMAAILLMSFFTGTLAVPVRPTVAPASTITPAPNLAFGNVTAMFGGNETTSNPINWGMGIFNIVQVYPSAIGQIAYVILFAIPFVMMWVANANMTLPGIIGIIFSLYVFLKIPGDYQMFAIVAMGISITAVIYSLATRRWT